MKLTGEQKWTFLGVGLGLITIHMVVNWSKKNLFGQLVSNQKVRGNDKWGSGAYEASRVDDIHEGIDIVAKPGTPIKSPVSGTISRYAYPYGDKSYAGVAIDTQAYFHKIFYVAPAVSPGQRVIKGQIVGYAQNIAAKYPGITPHVHWEVWDKSANNKSINPLKPLT